MEGGREGGMEGGGLEIGWLRHTECQLCNNLTSMPFALSFVQPRSFTMAPILV